MKHEMLEMFHFSDCSAFGRRSNLLCSLSLSMSHIRTWLCFFSFAVHVRAVHVHDQRGGAVSNKKKLAHSGFLTYKCNIGPFYTRGRIIRLDELGQTFVVRLVLRLQYNVYNDGQKSHYSSRRFIFRCAS